MSELASDTLSETLPDVDIVPTIVDENLSYIPWGGDNLMPFKIIEHIEKDETQKIKSLQYE